MNKNLYRIVFNKARGLLMVVADITASGRAASSPSSGLEHTQRRRISALSSLSFSLLLALDCVSLSAQANIIRHTLLVRKYNLDEITKTITDYIDQCEGKYWTEIAQKLSSAFAWEFED
ncbi:Imm8 family immunity protein [Yersinia enterocolitica]